MEWIWIYILNIIGIIVYFNNRFTGRTDKSVPFSFKFWFADNRQELINTILLNFGLMVIAKLLDRSGKLETLLLKLPEILQVIAMPGLSFALGLGLTHAVYSLYLEKVKDIKKKVDEKPAE